MPQDELAPPRYRGPNQSTYPVDIYIIRDPRTNCIRYIGQTNWFEARKIEHEFGGWGQVGDVRSWISFMKAEGLKPIFEIIDHVNDSADALKREAEWIRVGRLLGWPLLNKTSKVWELVGIEPITHKVHSEVPPRQTYHGAINS